MRFRIIQTPLIIATLLLLVITTADPALAQKNYFSATTTESSNLKIFPKWTSILSRYNSKDKITCDTKKCSDKTLEPWQKFLEKTKSLPKKQQIDAVNRFINKTTYIQDSSNWGKSDYWAIPSEFFARNGDCEDYAIAKYFSLKQLGFSANDLRIVVLQDLNLRVMHAILVVRNAGEWFVLDNQAQNTILTSKIYHYKPIFAINEHRWWRYKY